MTVEELEIIISASIEPALKEIKKLIPQIKQNVEQATSVAQKSFNSMNMSKAKNSFEKAVDKMKNKLLGFTNKQTEVKIKVSKDEASKQITQLEKEIESLQKKIEARKIKMNDVDTQMTAIQGQVVQDYTPDGAKLSDGFIDKKLAENKEYSALGAEWSKLDSEVASYNAKLKEAKSELAQIKQQVGATGGAQSKLGAMFASLKSKIQQAAANTKNLKVGFNSVSKITAKVTGHVKNMGSEMKGSIGKVMRYAGALFSLRSIYTTLSSCSQAWLSSQNAGAQQLSANIEYMKYAMGASFAPVIQYITDLIYKLMKAIQSLVYSFSGVNIFAKATASSMKNASGSASKASKALSGIHGEINNVSSNDGGSTGGSVTPNIDMTQIDTSITSAVEKIKAKLAQLFQPVQESWNIYGQPLLDNMKNAFSGIKELFGSIKSSFGEVWTNGTGTETINLLLQGWTAVFGIIGNISRAFAEAWNNGNTGTTIVQNLWSGFNNLYSIVIGIYQAFEEWTASESFQVFANSIMNICKTLSGWFQTITQKLKEIWDNGGKETFTNLLEFISKVIETVGVVLATLDPVIQWVLDVVTPVISGIVQAIGFVIDALSGVLDFIIGVFTGDWNKAWQGIKDFFSGIWNAIKTVVSTVFNAIKTIITTVLGVIKTVWDKVWNGIKTVVKNIWNAIWNAIKSVINSILKGIESFVNGIIRGINFVLSGISKVANAVGSLIGLSPISLQLSTISLPRLAKGNVAYSETVAVFGEYSGAANNPEITAPQNIMRETFSEVLDNHEFGKANGEVIQLSVYVGNKKLGEILLDNLRSIRRQTGQGIEALVGG